ncbi:MAG TPA: RidA family protein [Myxococcota bacterium]|nr:RidA family protein [Myxococcota bacterium]
MKQSELVIPASMRVMYDRFHFAAAARAREWLLCSGQIGTGPDGRGIADPEAQFVAAFENVGAVLAEAGLGFGDVVEITTFHVGLMQHIGTFMQVKDRYLPEPYPAWTAIGVVELAVPGGLVEIRATARRAVRVASAKSSPKRAAKRRPAGKRGARRKKA